MAGVRIELEGVDELFDSLRELRQASAQAALDGHRQQAERLAAQVRASAPKRPGASGQATGHLASLVRTRRLSPFLYDVLVGQEGDTEYLGHYEFGTRHQPARPFVRPAAARAEAGHESAMQAAARKRIK